MKITTIKSKQKKEVHQYHRLLQNLRATVQRYQKIQKDGNVETKKSNVEGNPPIVEVMIEKAEKNIIHQKVEGRRAIEENVVVFIQLTKADHIEKMEDHHCQLLMEMQRENLDQDPRGMKVLVQCPKKMKIPVQCPKEMEIPTYRPKEMKTFVRCPKEMKISVQCPKEIRILASRPEEMKIPVQCPKGMQIPVPCPKEMEIPACRPDEMKIPVQCPKEIKIPAWCPKEVKSPAWRPEEMKTPIQRPGEIKTPIQRPGEMKTPIQRPGDIKIPVRCRKGAKEVREEKTLKEVETREVTSIVPEEEQSFVHES